MSLANMFKAVVFVVYVDPADRDNTQAVLEAMCKARNQLPINLSSEEGENGNEGEFTINRTRDILFVVSHTSNLMFFNFDESHKGPQALLMPYGETFNAMEKYLPNLKTFDDLELADWLKKAENSEKEFAVGPEDDSNESNRKESLQRWYSMNRFLLESKYMTRDYKLLTDSQSIVNYLNDMREGKL
jgi:hypothetical protein